MYPNASRNAIAAGILTLLLLIPFASRAQTLGATLSGTVTGATDKPVPDARVTATNLATGKSEQAQTNAEGRYNFSNLPAGKYEISASAVALSPQTATLTLAAGAKLTKNFALTAGLSLGSLGFSASQTQGSAREQALLNKRSHMLQIHQKLGLITAFPMVATVIASFAAHGRHSSATSRDIHIGLGSATAGLYFATAYYAIFAPKVAGVKSEGPIRFHKALMWIHGPGMILTPILGAMAESQMNQGERVHGIAKYHGDVALVTAIAYGLALVSAAKPSWLPWLSHHTKSAFDFHHSAVRTASAGHSRLKGGTEIAKNGT